MSLSVDRSLDVYEFGLFNLKRSFCFSSKKGNIIHDFLIEASGFSMLCITKPYYARVKGVYVL